MPTITLLSGFALKYCRLLTDLRPNKSFRELKNLQACEQMHPGTWQKFCLFFKRKSTATSVDDKIQIPGLRRPLFPHQAYAVFWMLMTENTSAGGGFLADGTGLGKVKPVNEFESKTGYDNNF